jgi:hypothetical protein
MFIDIFILEITPEEEASNARSTPKVELPGKLHEIVSSSACRRRGGHPSRCMGMRRPMLNLPKPAVGYS